MKVHRNEHNWLNEESTCAWTYQNSRVMRGTWARGCEAFAKQQNLSPRLLLASAWKPAGKGRMDYSRVPKAACLGNLPHFWPKCPQRLSKKTCWFVNNQQCYLLFWQCIPLYHHRYISHHYIGRNTREVTCIQYNATMTDALWGGNRNPGFTCFSSCCLHRFSSFRSWQSFLESSRLCSNSDGKQDIECNEQFVTGWGTKACWDVHHGWSSPSSCAPPQHFPAFVSEMQKASAWLS